VLSVAQIHAAAIHQIVMEPADAIVLQGMTVSELAAVVMYGLTALAYVAEHPSWIAAACVTGMGRRVVETKAVDQIPKP